MGTDKADIYHTVLIIHSYHKTIFVSSDVEDNPVIPWETGMSHLHWHIGALMSAGESQAALLASLNQDLRGYCAGTRKEKS